MNLLIDADACPVTDIAIKLANQHHVPVILFCDDAHSFARTDVQVITVMRGADSVDFALLNRLSKGDVVITQDYGLAAMCLAKGAHVIRQDGLIFNDENILPLLNQRHETKKRLRAGGRVHGPKKRDSAQDEAFEASLKSLFSNLHENTL